MKLGMQVGLGPGHLVLHVTNYAGGVFFEAVYDILHTHRPTRGAQKVIYLNMI